MINLSKVASVALAAALAASIAPAAAQHMVIDGRQNAEYLFVLSSLTGSADNDALKLESVPSVVFFADRPARIAGHMSVEKFMQLWQEFPGSFATDAPNATLSLLGNGDVSDVVVELTGAEQDGTGARFTFRVLSGTMPEGTFGPASLFIDPECAAAGVGTCYGF